MSVFRNAIENPEILRQVGAQAFARARAAGAPVHYMDPHYGNDIIREYPDGRRERLPHGPDGVALSIPPRAAA